MDKSQFQILTRKLDLISRLLAFDLLKNINTQKERIIALSSLGLSPTEIAEILGTTQNTVNVTLSKFRSKRKKEKSEGLFECLNVPINFCTIYTEL